MNHFISALTCRKTTFSTNEFFDHHIVFALKSGLVLETTSPHFTESKECKQIMLHEHRERQEHLHAVSCGFMPSVHCQFS